MIPHTYRLFLRIILLSGTSLAAVHMAAAFGKAPPHQETGKRKPWTTSRVTGSPESAPPYRSERVFAKLGFRNAVHLERCPVDDRFYVLEQEGKVYSFAPSSAVEKADLILDLPRDLKSCKPDTVVRQFTAAYSMTFHPRFEQNRHCFLCYAVETHDKKGQTAIERVSRFTMNKETPARIDPASEKVLLEWRTEPGGHNGGCLCFGPDGFLYVSMGDAAPPSPPDGYNTGQDLQDFLSTILRIDVDRQEAAKAYSVPKDNPFVHNPGAKPEIWAYGFRNPWKMNFDRATGDLWVGDVGWELWEMVYRVRKGGNYGWSVMEGPQVVRGDASRGPTPIQPPTIAFPHSEAASITGGLVYHGSRFKDLAGCYICGDWMTSKFWATRFEGDRKVSHREIAQGREKIISFAEDRQGEIYWLDYQEKDGGIYTLSANTRPGHDPAAFPRKLSDTGIFSSVFRHEPAVGVVSYRIQAEPWMDGASAERLIAVPGNGMVKVYDEPQPIPGAAWFRTRYFFPKDTVLVKTMGFASEGSQRSDRRRIETQLMHFDGNDWRGYTYRWNAGGTDADLVPATGDEKELTNGDVSSPGGTHKHTWTFHGRGACLQCHNPWAGTLLGFTLEQLDRPAGSENQLAEWSRIGLMSSVDNKGQPHNPPKPLKASTPYYSPQDSNRDLNARARMYLQINCAHCHQSAAGGTALIDLRLSMRPEELRAIDQPSTQGTFGIPGGRLLAPGDPYRSIMLYRMAKNGSGRMPHIGSDVVDRTGYALLHDWVSSLPGKQNHSTTDEEAKCLERFRQPAGDASDRARDLDRLLSSPSGAMRLAWALDNQQIPASQRPMLVEKGANHPEVTVRDLFERFLPGDRRIKRLGILIRPENILVLKGDPKRGEALFFQPGATQCVNCHRIGNKGGAIGPELSGIGKKYPRAKILETILEPSREIDKNHAAYVLETTAGQVLTGLIIKRGATGILLRDAQGKEHSFATSQIEQVTASKKSLMPEQLLRDLTAQQAADLLEFLCQQK